MAEREGFELEPTCGRERSGSPAGEILSERSESKDLLLRKIRCRIWRRERDSNPRYPFRYSGFQDRLFQPLTHLSAWRVWNNYKAKPTAGGPWTVLPTLPWGLVPFPFPRCASVMYKAA